MAVQQFFYSQQIRRFLLQISRVFSNFQVEYGTDDAGNQVLRTVPVRYGDASKVVNAIIRQNSENATIPTPMMSFYITGIDYKRDWVQEPHHVEKLNVRQRDYNENTGELLTTQGNAFTIERLMPVPHEMTINVDMWTSNTEQKFQLFEQIAWIFNPSLEIQSTDNFLDWTSLTRMERTGFTWSNRSVPQGVDETIDIMTFNFSMPFWITPPAKQKKLGVVRTIVASVFDESGDLDDGIIDSGLLIGNRVKTTWNNHSIFLLNGEVLLKDHSATYTNQNDTLDSGTPTSVGDNNVKWRELLEGYGDFQNGISQLRISLDDDTDIIGTVSYHPSDDYKLLFNPDADTLPTNTLNAVNKIIDPLRSGPGAGLPTAQAGQRYLIIQDIGDSNNFDGPDAWKGVGYDDDSALGDFVANANDIIEYDGDKWTVAFDASATTTTNYVTNVNTGIQYKWDGTEWLLSYQGLHTSGNWAIII